MGVLFVNFLKVFRALLVKKRFAKYLSADGCFVKTTILLIVMITTMQSVS